MKSVSIPEAKTRLSELVERVQAGEEFIIAKAGRPAARLVPIDFASRPIKIGGLKAPGPVPDDFDTMFEGEIEALFAGAGARPVGTEPSRLGTASNRRAPRAPRSRRPRS